jgi:hypothetical protein
MKDQILISPKRDKWDAQFVKDNIVICSIPLPQFTVPKVVDEFFFEHPEIIKLTEFLNTEFPQAKVQFMY